MRRKAQILIMRENLSNIQTNGNLISSFRLHTFAEGYISFCEIYLLARRGFIFMQFIFNSHSLVYLNITKKLWYHWQRINVKFLVPMGIYGEPIRPNAFALLDSPDNLFNDGS